MQHCVSLFFGFTDFIPIGSRSDPFHPFQTVFRETAMSNLYALCSEAVPSSFSSAKRSPSHCLPRNCTFSLSSAKRPALLQKNLPFSSYHAPHASTSYGAYSGQMPTSSAAAYAPLSVSTVTAGGSGTTGPGPLSGPGWGQTSSQGAAPPGILPPPMPASHFPRDPYSMPVPVLQREYDMLRRYFLKCCIY